MGGSIVAALRIADTVHGDDFECTIVGTESTSDGVEVLRQEYPRLELLTLPHHFPRHSFASLPLRRWLAANVARFDLVHSHGIFNFPYLHAYRAARRARRPFVLSPHNSLDPYDLRKKCALKRYWFGPRHVRPMLEYASSLLCTAEREAREAETYGANPPRHVLPLPVPAPAPRRLPNGGASLRARFDLPAQAIVMLFLSRLDRKKGLELVLHALQCLAPRIPALHLAVAGDVDSAYGAELRALGKSLGVDDRVRWMGFLSGDDKARAYDESDFFVLPSYNENFGLVLVEALYHGLPLVLSDQVYIADALARADVARVCHPTTESATDAIGWAAEAADWRRDARQRAPSAAARLYSPDVLRPAYLRYYDALLATPPARR